jgi:hypothetical protein
MTAKQKHNYSGSGRRVRPTSPKLTPAQIDVLQELSDDSNCRLAVHGSTVYWLDISDHTRWPFPACRFATFQALLKREYIVSDGADGDFEMYAIVDFGRAALVSAGGF